MTAGRLRAVGPQGGEVARRLRGDERCRTRSPGPGWRGRRPGGRCSSSTWTNTPRGPAPVELARRVQEPGADAEGRGHAEAVAGRGALVDPGDDRVLGGRRRRGSPGSRRAHLVEEAGEGTASTASAASPSSPVTRASTSLVAALASGHVGLVERVDAEAGATDSGGELPRGPGRPGRRRSRRAARRPVTGVGESSSSDGCQPRGDEEAVVAVHGDVPATASPATGQRRQCPACQWTRR